MKIIRKGRLLAVEVLQHSIYQFKRGLTVVQLASVNRRPDSGERIYKVSCLPLHTFLDGSRHTFRYFALSISIGWLRCRDMLG